jgi:hypothetical protein
VALSEYGKRYFRGGDNADDRFGVDGCEGVADAPRNGWTPHPDDPGPPDPAGDDTEPEPTTWEPIDLGPWLRGEVEQPHPATGASRSDGQHLIYTGCEHAIVGATESGKTWLALSCVAAELIAGRHVAYFHYEEGDPGSTIERLLLLGVDQGVITGRLRFVAPSRPACREWIAELLSPAPTLVVHDGVNEAMALHIAATKDVEGWSDIRRRLVTPFTRIGAAVVSCDHMPIVRDGARLDAYGTVHKGNALDGARLVLENTAPFGRRMRGVSYVFVTKDRPGYLRAHGKPTKVPGKTFVGTLVVDDSQAFGPDFDLRFFAPKDDDAIPEGSDPAAELADTVHDVIRAQPDHTVPSVRMLLAELRKAGHKFTDTKVRDAVDDLIVAGRLTEVSGKRGAQGYQAVATASEEDFDRTASATASASASSIDDDARRRRTRDRVDEARSSPKQSEAVGEETTEEGST